MTEIDGPAPKPCKPSRREVPMSAREATPEEIAAVEAMYGQTIEELADEAERGYDTAKMVRGADRRGRRTMKKLMERARELADDVQQKWQDWDPDTQYELPEVLRGLAAEVEKLTAVADRRSEVVHGAVAALRDTHPPATYVPSTRIDQPDNQCIVDMRRGYRQALDDVESLLNRAEARADIEREIERRR